MGVRLCKADKEKTAKKKERELLIRRSTLKLELFKSVNASGRRPYHRMASYYKHSVHQHRVVKPTLPFSTFDQTHRHFTIIRDEQCDLNER